MNDYHAEMILNPKITDLNFDREDFVQRSSQL